MKKVVVVVLALLLVVSTASIALGQGDDEGPVITRDAPPDPAGVELVEVASGLIRPIYVTHAGDGSGRLFIVEQTGRVLIWQEGEVLPTPFLDLSARVTPMEGYSEQGLLGLAFHPDYAENGRFFVDYTDVDADTVVAEYAVSADDPNVADLDSARVLLTVDQPDWNHNGGYVGFGPDGYLYVTLGDGGSQGDPSGNGQNPWTLLSSILRLDVDADETPYGVPADNPFVESGLGRPEVWAWGLRNPWRISFDRATGDLYIADVGQDQWEEVNFQAADSAGGENYGWNRYEGSHPYSGGDAPPDMILPIAEYGHDMGCSISGGYVYRGEALPDLQGAYFYGDWCTGIIWAAYRDAAMAWHSDVFLDTDMLISSFGEDETGELYVIHYDTGNGRIFRFTAAE